MRPSAQRRAAEIRIWSGKGSFSKAVNWSSVIFMQWCKPGLLQNVELLQPPFGILQYDPGRSQTA